MLLQSKQPLDSHRGVGEGHQHDYKQASMQLAQERRQEYNDMVAAKVKALVLIIIFIFIFVVVKDLSV